MSATTTLEGVATLEEHADAPGGAAQAPGGDAVEASASAGEAHKSTLPSPSPSVAYLKKVEGMNWVWPMAPAQDETISDSG